MLLSNKKNILRSIGLVWLVALGLNLIWEYAHHGLYYLPSGKEMENFMLIKAALMDAFLITGLAILFWRIKYLYNRQWWLIIFGVIIAIILESYAITTGRWAYNQIMPIIPVIKTGLSPTLQLGVTGWLAFKLINFNKR